MSGPIGLWTVGSMDEFARAYTAGKAAAIKAHKLDRLAMAARGMKYKLGRLAKELLLGVP